jgi:xanthine dehydrogenase large subunit
MNMRSDPGLPESLGRQAVNSEVGTSRAHESAHLHVTGKAEYTDDLPELRGTLHLALGLSPIAHGRILSVNTEALASMPGVVAVFTARDIPGVNDCGPIVHDDPILAKDEVVYLGQPVFAIVATTRNLARRAAATAKEAIQVEELPAVLTAREAHAKQLYVLPPMHLSRGNPATAMKASLHQLRGSLSVGGQEQFYLEGQISYAAPQDDGGMKVWCSTQHPTEMQNLVAKALGLQANGVQVECRRMGGAFGGKESQSALQACIAAVAAKRLRRPVKLRLDRDDDFMITGRRHGFEYDYQVGFDDDGRILAVEVSLISNAGCSVDLSGPVMTRAMCHFDNAYWLPNVTMHGYSARTNTQSNTAFRGFGGPQGVIAIEAILDSVARKLHRDPMEVRRINYYGPERNVTPYQQPVEDNVIDDLTDQLLKSSGYASRREEIAHFNANNTVFKKGLAFCPVKFGISFNLTHLNQAGALVHVYTDGSVLVNHGGTEMGQGLNTKVAQIVAQELGVRFDRVRVTATDTHKVANTSATAASTGTDLNGKAAQDAARQIRQRLAVFAATSYGGSAKDVRFVDELVFANGREVTFQNLAIQAYLARIQLWSSGFYATPGLHWDRETMTGRPFYYFAYGAAVSEVVIDTTTGEWKLMRSDLLHDVGRSLNPALDIGQIEGAFVQGVGWLTSEELVWHSKSGALLTHAPSTYKIPTANDVPSDFRVQLYKTDNKEPTVHRSKAVGEPPLVLGVSVWLAIRDAISAAGSDRADPSLAAPATPEAVLTAIQAIKNLH